MGRTPCCSREGMNRGAWTALEDQTLTDYIKTYGEGRWRNIPKEAGLKRCGKSCRLRWLNYLRPDIKRGNITKEEEDLIIRLHKLLGNRWSLIAGRLPGRTDNEIKNYWNTTLGKKVKGEQPKQSKEVKKKTNIRSLPLTMVESSAIRTKALRCTKVLDNQQAPRDENNVEVELKSSGEALSITTEENNSQDFPMDFDVGQLFLPDHSDFEFWKLCQFDNRWPSLEQPLLFSEEMLKDCKREDR